MFETSQTIDKMRLDKMDIYIRDRNFYYSFHYLKAISGFSNLKLQYLLDKEEISRVNYKDNYVFKLDDLYASEIFKDLIQPTIMEMGDDTGLT